MPNISQSVESENITMFNITPLPNTHNAILYLIAFNSDNETIAAKQIIVNLEN